MMLIIQGQNVAWEESNSQRFFCFQLTIENVGEADEAKSYSCGLTFMGYNNNNNIK